MGVAASRAAATAKTRKTRKTRKTVSPTSREQISRMALAGKLSRGHLAAGECQKY
jgi:hypothetical protein